jgi:hypothetical protein
MEATAHAGCVQARPASERALRPPRDLHPLLKAIPEVPELKGRCTVEHFQRLGVRRLQHREYLKEVCWLSAKRGYTFAFQATLSAKFGVPVSTIRNWQNRAVNDGYLTVVRTGRENRLFPNWVKLGFVAEEVGDQNANSSDENAESCRSPSLDMNPGSPGSRSPETTAGQPPVDSCPPVSTGGVAAAHLSDQPGYDAPAASAGEAEAGSRHNPAATSAEAAPDLRQQLEELADRLDGPDDVRDTPREPTTSQAPTPAAINTGARGVRFDPATLLAHPDLKTKTLALNGGLSALRVLARERFGLVRNDAVLERLLAYHDKTGVRHAGKAIHDFIHDARVEQHRIDEYEQHARFAAKQMRVPKSKQAGTSQGRVPDTSTLPEISAPTYVPSDQELAAMKPQAKREQSMKTTSAPPAPKWAPPTDKAELIRYRNDLKDMITKMPVTHRQYDNFSDQLKACDAALREMMST